MEENVATECKPWSENFPFRYIKTNEFKGKVSNDYQKKQVYLRNSQGKIDTDSKYWNLKKVLKSTTQVVHWQFKMHDQFFVAAKSILPYIDEVVSIYESDKFGHYEIDNPIVIYRSYVDLETAIDRFAAEYIAVMINERNPEIEFMFNKINE